METTAAQSRLPAGQPVEAVAEDPPPSLRSRVAGGLRWKLVSQVVAQLSRTVVGILLAHLLLPADFGLAAMALTFTGLTTIFTDLALGAALIQRPLITERDRSTVFWTTIACGAAISAIGVAISPFVADFFSHPEIAPLFAATSATAFLYAVAGTQMALLTRALNFRSLELREIASTIVGGVAAIALAFAGAGAWAIVGQNLVVAFVSMVLVWRLSSWRPRFVYSRESLRTLGSFGIKTFTARLLSYANLNGDNLLIGRFLGSVPLGVYAIAYNVMFLPATRVAAPVQQVLFPAFAQLQDDHEKLGRSWIRGSQLVAALNVSAFVGLLVVAPDFVPVVLGDKWHAVVPVLQLLCLAGIAQTMQTLNWSVLQAVGDSGRLLRFMFFSTAITVGAFVAGLQWGVVGVAGLFAASRLVGSLVFAHTTCRRIGLPLRRYLFSFSPIVRVALPMGVAVYLLRLGLVEAGVAQALRLVLLVLAGVGIYCILVGLQARDLAVELFRLLLPGVARRFGATTPVPAR